MDIFRSIRISLAFFAVFTLGFDPQRIPNEYPTLQPVTISAHAGFPLTDPQSIEFGSPSVVDINGDGLQEILIGDGGGCVWAWDRNGKTLAGFPLHTIGNSCDGPRINGPIAIGDIDGDFLPEIVAGTDMVSKYPGQRGKVYAWNHDGSLISGWPKEMDWNLEYGEGQAEVYSVALANVIGDRSLEVIAGTSNNAANGGTEETPNPNLYVWQGNGQLLSGFPNGLNSGIFGFVGTANLSGDSHEEIITPRDHRHLHVYNSQGTQLPGWPIETFVDPSLPSEYPFVEFTRSAPAIGDLDNDGQLEIVIAGKVRGDRASGRPEINSAVMVFQPNGQRAPGWSVARLGDGPPVADSFSPSQATALADLDQDGKLEIVVTMNDGTARAYRANGDLLWKYNFAAGRTLFASEPVIGDINNDGKLETVFGTYSPDGSAGDAVGLIALTPTGSLLAGFPLKLDKETSSVKKGIRAAPTIADFDGDCYLEILAGSWSGTIYVWDLSTRSDTTHVPWPTTRHDLQRTGTIFPGNAAVQTEAIAGYTNWIFLPTINRGCQPR
jgi:hypothetical protein